MSFKKIGNKIIGSIILKTVPIGVLFFKKYLGILPVRRNFEG
jgi:hypothetical protein